MKAGAPLSYGPVGGSGGRKNYGSRRNDKTFRNQVFEPFKSSPAEEQSYTAHA